METPEEWMENIKDHPDCKQPPLLTWSDFKGFIEAIQKDAIADKEKELQSIEYLVRNWVNDSTELANMPLREMVLYALREENTGKIKAINKAEKAETRTERLLRVETQSQPWTETPTILVKVVADAKALNMNPQAFCEIIAEELIQQIQQQTSHF